MFSILQNMAQIQPRFEITIFLLSAATEIIYLNLPLNLHTL